MSVGEFTRCIDGYKELVDRQMKQQDRLNHILGNYLAIGVNSPKKYPKEPLLSESKKEATVYTSDEAYERIARIKYKRK